MPRPNPLREFRKAAQDGWGTTIRLIIIIVVVVTVIYVVGTQVAPSGAATVRDLMKVVGHLLPSG